MEYYTSIFLWLNVGRYMLTHQHIYVLFYVSCFIIPTYLGPLHQTVVVIVRYWLLYWSHKICISFPLFEYKLWWFLYYCFLMTRVNSCTIMAFRNIIRINYPWSVCRCPANCESAAILWSCCFTVHESIFCRQSATARSKPSTMLSDWRVSSSATSSSARNNAVSMINCKHTDANFIYTTTNSQNSCLWIKMYNYVKIIWIFSTVINLTNNVFWYLLISYVTLMNNTI